MGAFLRFLERGRVCKIREIRLGKADCDQVEPTKKEHDKTNVLKKKRL